MHMPAGSHAANAALEGSCWQQGPPIHSISTVMNKPGSDDDEVLEVAGKNEGIKLIRRPAHLTTDTATSVDAVLHALEVLKEQGITAKRVMLLQPTSPLRRAEDIQATVKRMDETGAASVISVCEMEHLPLWANTLPEDGKMDGFLRPEVKDKKVKICQLFTV